MVNVEALKAKLKERQDGDSVDLSVEQETRPGSDPRKVGLYILLGICAVLVLLFLLSYVIFKDPSSLGPPQACFKGDVCLDLMIMQTKEELETGLSNHTSIDRDEGMLFVFATSDIQRMWMKYMDFPIDMFWLADNGKILHIEKDAVPCDSSQSLCEVFEPNVRARYVLETAAGFAAENTLYDGHKVELKNIGQ